MLTNYSKLLAGQQGTDVPLSNSPSMGRNSRPGPLSPEPQAQGYCSMNRIASAELKSSKTHPFGGDGGESLSQKAGDLRACASGR